MGYKLIHRGPRCKYLRIQNHFTRVASFYCVMGHYPGPPDKVAPNKCTAPGKRSKCEDRLIEI